MDSLIAAFGTYVGLPVAAFVVIVSALSWMVAYIHTYTRPYAEERALLARTSFAVLTLNMVGQPIGVYLIWSRDGFGGPSHYILFFLCCVLSGVSALVSSAAQKKFDGVEDGLQRGLRETGLSLGMPEEETVGVWGWVEEKFVYISGTLVFACLVGVFLEVVHDKYGWAILSGTFLATSIIQISLWRAIRTNRPFPASIRLDSGEIEDDVLVFYVGGENVRYYSKPTQTFHIVRRDRVADIIRLVVYKGKEAGLLPPRREDPGEVGEGGSGASAKAAIK